MRLSLARLAARRSALTAPIPSNPFTSDPLAGSGGAVASWLIAHTPVPPHLWPAKFSPTNFPIVPDLLRDVLEPAKRRHAEFVELEQKEEGGAAVGRTLPELEPYLMLAWDKVGTTPSLTDDLGNLRIDWRIPGRAPFTFSYPPSSSDDTSPSDLLPPIESLPKASANDRKEIHVCTHGQRDCRCSDVGGALVDDLRKEIERRGLNDEIDLFECSHVGGHKYAANALLFPSHNLLGNLRPTDASMLVESVVSHPLSPTSASPSVLLPLWRGTTGISKTALQSLHAEAVETSTGIAIPWETREVSPTPQEAEEEEVTLVFRSWEGDEAVFEAKVGETLMDLGKRLELGAIEGVCGGVLECATCHCYLPEDPMPPPVPEPSEAEEDMLYTAMERTENSRLGCQIIVDKSLAEWCAKGGRIGLPRY